MMIRIIETLQFTGLEAWSSSEGRRMCATPFGRGDIQRAARVFCLEEDALRGTKRPKKIENDYHLGSLRPETIAIKFTTALVATSAEDQQHEAASTGRKADLHCSISHTS